MLGSQAVEREVMGGCGQTGDMAMTQCFHPSPGNRCAGIYVPSLSPLALRVFCFLFLRKKNVDIDFNAHVVLYFHAKILMYLNVFYFIKCVL